MSIGVTVALAAWCAKSRVGPIGRVHERASRPAQVPPTARGLPPSVVRAGFVAIGVGAARKAGFDGIDADRARGYPPSYTYGAPFAAPFNATGAVAAMPFQSVSGALGAPPPAQAGY
jgi:hypothetical protein